MTITHPASIAARFDSRDNALNLLRLLLAALVIVSHAAPIGGFGHDPKIGDVQLGTFAVGGFFAISGFLITGSRFRLPLVPYLWRRFLRIMPGLAVCVVFTAFVAAGLGGLVRGGWSAGDAVGYVAAKLALMEAHPTVGATLAGAPYPDSWNGALWTIRYEIACYVVAGVFAGFGWFRRNRALSLIAFAAATVAGAVAAAADVSLSGAPGKAALLTPFFLAGVVLLQYADRFPLTGRVAVLAAAVLAASLAVGGGRFLAPLPLAYLLLWAATALPSWLRRVGSCNDLSYGVYLYGFVTQQLLVVAGAQQLGQVGFTVVCLVAVVPLAAASWFLVERPAMRAKNWLPARPTVARSPAVTSS